MTSSPLARAIATSNVGPMLFGSLAELRGDVAQGTLGEQVHHLAAGTGDPVHGAACVHEAQGLHAVYAAGFGCPCAYLAEGFALPFRDPCGHGLYAVDLQVIEKKFRDGELLLVVEGHAGGLLPVPESSVHDLDPFGFQRHQSFLFCSNASIFAFCSRR